MKSTWHEMLKNAFIEDGEDFSKMICTLSNEQLQVEFNSGYGCSEGAPFTAWGEKWVYFPIVYDGSEWVGHAPRNPCEISMQHQGGE